MGFEKTAKPNEWGEDRKGQEEGWCPRLVKFLDPERVPKRYEHCSCACYQIFNFLKLREYEPNAVNVAQTFVTIFPIKLPSRIFTLSSH